MKRTLFFGLLAIVLIFGIIDISCKNISSNDYGDTWSNVTNFSQVNGTWKAPSSTSHTEEYDIIVVNINNYTITFNATQKTMSTTGLITTTFSGGTINELWPFLKEDMEWINELDNITVSFDDANHSYTATYNNYSQTLTDAELTKRNFKINQNGSKLKMASGDIFNKQ